MRVCGNLFLFVFSINTPKEATMQKMVQLMMNSVFFMDIPMSCLCMKTNLYFSVNIKHLLITYMWLIVV